MNDSELFSFWYVLFPIAERQCIYFFPILVLVKKINFLYMSTQESKNKAVTSQSINGTPLVIVHFQKVLLRDRGSISSRRSCQVALMTLVYYWCITPFFKYILMILQMFTPCCPCFTLLIIMMLTQQWQSYNSGCCLSSLGKIFPSDAANQSQANSYTALI